MTKTRKKNRHSDAGIKSTRVEHHEEVLQAFDESAQRGLAGRQQVIDKLREHDATSPELAGGIDAACQDSDVCEESVSGENPTPDQNIVEELGKAAGLTFENNEPLNANAKLKARDQSRWELNPASSVGYDERIKHEGEYKGN